MCLDNEDDNDDNDDDDMKDNDVDQADDGDKQLSIVLLSAVAVVLIGITRFRFMVDGNRWGLTDCLLMETVESVQWECQIESVVVTEFPSVLAFFARGRNQSNTIPTTSQTR